MLGQNETSQDRTEGCGEPGAVQSLSTATGGVNPAVFAHSHPR